MCLLGGVVELTLLLVFNPRACAGRPVGVRGDAPLKKCSENKKYSKEIPKMRQKRRALKPTASACC